MRTVMLEFVSNEDLNALLANDGFAQDINYLMPNRLDDRKIVLTDPVPQHDRLDSEVVVLSMFANGIKRILFPDTGYNIEFLVPFANAQKGGLRHDTQIVIHSTTVQV